jgi:hypothetical protein
MFSLTRLFCVAAAYSVAVSANIPVALAEELTVNTDQSQIITMQRAPSTVVVGNPSIADVTVQGNQIFVHGRVFGKTNVIVLDEGGNQLADFAVNVVTEDNYNVVVFKAGVGNTIEKNSYTCKTDCESVFHIGDSLEYYKLINEQQKNKLGLAQGQKAGENGGDGAQTAPPQ